MKISERTKYKHTHIKVKATQEKNYSTESEIKNNYSKVLASFKLKAHCSFC